LDKTENASKCGNHPPRFLIDGMLGSLAVKLRILGYDSEYERSSKDEELLREAKKTERILVTADSDLFIRCSRLHLPSILVKEKSDRDRICAVLDKIGVSKLHLDARSRCSVCNGDLNQSGADEFGRIVFVCADCGKRYWRGSHWKKLEPLFAEVSETLERKGN
jgi:uncharacterized protein